MVARKKATEATPKTEDKDRSKNHIRATVRSLFYLVVNLQHGKSMRLPAATTHERKYRI